MFDAKLVCIALNMLFIANEWFFFIIKFRLIESGRNSGVVLGWSSTHSAVD